MLFNVNGSLDLDPATAGSEGAEAGVGASAVVAGTAVVVSVVKVVKAPNTPL